MVQRRVKRVARALVAMGKMASVVWEKVCWMGLVGRSLMGLFCSWWWEIIRGGLRRWLC